MYSDSDGQGVEPPRFDGGLELPEVVEGAADDDLLLALLAGAFAHLLQAVVDEVQLERLQVQPLGGEPEDAHALEHEGDAAAGAHVAAPVLEVHADVGHGAHHVVGRGLHQDGDAVRRVTLVEDDLVVLGVLAAGALDGGLDLVLGHVRGAGVLERPAEGRVGVRAGAASLHRDGDVLADPREHLRHLVPAGEHRGLAGFEDASHGPENGRAPGPSSRLSVPLLLRRGQVLVRAGSAPCSPSVNASHAKRAAGGGHVDPHPGPLARRAAVGSTPGRAPRACDHARHGNARRSSAPSCACAPTSASPPPARRRRSTRAPSPAPSRAAG